MQKKQCVRFTIKGLVQGVWFRASTQEEANRLGITGWVRNTPDGGVEVMASGGEAELVALSEWLKKGPELARVDEVIQEEAPLKVFDRFYVK